MEINAKTVAALRAKTGIGMMDCKKALVEANGNEEEAIIIYVLKFVKSQTIENLKE